LMPTGLAGGVGFRASKDMPSHLNAGTSWSKERVRAPNGEVL
jgi:hypothetical protein